MTGLGVERRQKPGAEGFDISAEGVGMAVGGNTEERKGRVLWVVGGQEFEDGGVFTRWREKNGN